MEEKEKFWRDCQHYISERLSDQSFDNWVAPVYPTRIGDQTITLAVPNALTKNYWERHLSGYVIQFSLEVYGLEYTPTFVIVPEDQRESNQAKKVVPEVEDTGDFSESQLNPNYVFETFVIGEGNKMANGAALAVVDSPGKTYNPLLIYGGVGLGKTHLMQAIGNEIKRKQPSARIKYSTSESFMNDFITAIRDGSQAEFRSMYREIDVLLIDDIQFLSKKDKTQEEFFHTFNELYNNNKQIVLTSDRLPNNITNLEERLISRFKWGLSTDITPPDLETRIAILRKKASSEQLDVSPDTLTYIANNVDTNIRELEGALVRVIAYAAIQGKEIDTELAASALHNIINKGEAKPLTPDEVIDYVSRYYQITSEDIRGKKRTKNIVFPRQVAMYLTRELTEMSFPKIGEYFGNKNHTTVIHAYEKITDEIETDIQLKNEINQLKQRLQR
ncbi:chromosomal replication initiator protein DnaA [Ruoffia tabacinasalis]|uniref:chromosomal replication initiator protein DnaA n=1 Tax=Ruoffia tabacinasalis TaxID=87458 RepID=UPI0030D5BF1E